VKISKARLKQIIKEEMQKINELAPAAKLAAKGGAGLYAMMKGTADATGRSFGGTNHEIVLGDGTRIEVPLMPGETTSSPTFRKRVNAMMRDAATQEHTPAWARDGEDGQLMEGDDDPDAAVDEEPILDDGDEAASIRDDDELESMLANIEDSIEDLRAKLGMS
tara:strand:- start:10 stop:501 length:492 start_codon:yes stop_codon:yes gene_type:complete